MATKKERLTVLSGVEQFAIYGLPDFDDGQRMQYLSFTEGELALLFNRPRIHAQVYFALQLGYFKAKHAFFQFSWEEAKEDLAFIVHRYFNDSAFIPEAITKHELYTQRNVITVLFGYRLWSVEFLPLLTQQAGQIVLRDVAPNFIAAELNAFLNEQKIVRPGYVTLQKFISKVLSAERRRLSELIDGMIDKPAKNSLEQLLVREDTLSELAALKQDAKHFGYRQMVVERQKRATLEPIYRLAKTLLPKLLNAKNF